MSEIHRDGSYDASTSSVMMRRSVSSGHEDTAPSNGIRIDNETMYGWLICKVDGPLVHSVLYGQFSKELLPPAKGTTYSSHCPCNDGGDAQLMLAVQW